MNTLRRALFALAVLASWVGLPSVQAQSVGPPRTESGGTTATAVIDPETAPRPEARALRIGAPLTIDGVADEDAWAGAEVMTGFRQALPQTGALATEQTEVRVLYDDNTLYVFAICLDSDMDHLTVNSLVQDFETRDADVFGVTIDPYLDRRNAIMFLINPAGAVKDGQVYDNSRNYNLEWEAVIEVATSRTANAWTVELAIPFSSLRFTESPQEQSWGFQFSRRVRRKSEESYWSPLARRELVHRMEKAGTIHGFQGMRGGGGIQVKPYFTASNASGSLEAVGAGDSGIDGGFDIKYGVTPRLTADFTFRTDFSQVEVDQERVNLTRFSLFFPEKRDFFLENAGTFTFGDVSERNYKMGSSLRDFTLFHSRRIGLDASGLPLPIAGGGRLTGQAGAWSIGLLEMQTQSQRGLPAENFALARVRRQVLGNSDIGAIIVNRQATDGSGVFNRSYGADANIRMFGNMVVNTYLAGTDAQDVSSGDQWAGRVSAAWRDALWDASAFVKKVGEDFDPGLGFVRRAGVREAYATVGAHPEVRGLREINPFAEIDYLTDPSGVLVTRDATLGFGVDFRDGSTLSLTRTQSFERLDRDFRVRSTAVVPAGAYDFGLTSARYQSNSGRAFSGSLTYTDGGYFNGDRRSIGLGALWRANEHVEVDLFADRNQITLPDARFDADVYGARVTWGLTTRAFSSAFMQYNAEAQELFTNVRINVIHAPLSDLFLVYTERRSTNGGGVIDQLVSFKVTKLFAF